MNQLLAKARQQIESSTPHVSEGLKDFARKLLDGDAA